jgi:hypothetical protein
MRATLPLQATMWRILADGTAAQAPVNGRAGPAGLSRRLRSRSPLPATDLAKANQLENSKLHGCPSLEHIPLILNHLTTGQWRDVL